MAIPTRLSAHFVLKKIQSQIEDLKYNVIEQVVVNQRFVRAGGPPAKIDTLNLCKAGNTYTVLRGTESGLTELSLEQLTTLIPTLAERDRFPAQRYLQTIQLAQKTPHP